MSSFYLHSCPSSSSQFSFILLGSTSMSLSPFSPHSFHLFKRPPLLTVFFSSFSFFVIRFCLCLNVSFRLFSLYSLFFSLFFPSHCLYLTSLCLSVVVFFYLFFPFPFTYLNVPLSDSSFLFLSSPFYFSVLASPSLYILFLFFFICRDSLMSLSSFSLFSTSLSIFFTILCLVLFPV